MAIERIKMGENFTISTIAEPKRQVYIVNIYSPNIPCIDPIELGFSEFKLQDIVLVLDIVFPTIVWKKDKKANAKLLSNYLENIIAFFRIGKLSDANIGKYKNTP